MGRLFGTDGVRGIANKEVTGELAYKLGRAAAYFLTRETIHNPESRKKPIMIIGKDTRISGDMLEAALTAGMTSVGIDVIKLGIIPTPGVAYLTSTLDVSGGVMISASHNPIADNGIKFFNQNGYKLTDKMEDVIEELIFNDYQQIPTPTHTRVGIVESNPGLVEEYVNYLVSTVDHNFGGLKVVLDCANGAAYRVAPAVLRQLGAELIVINDHPDGEKINVDCGSTHPEHIRQQVLAEGADVGIAHDGDADRVLLVDEKGEIIDGDKIMAICALDLLKRGELKGKTLVTTAYSNLGLCETIEAAGGRVSITNNGDRYVLQEMLEHGYNLGGEKSGHVIFLEYNHTGDGVLTAIQVLSVIQRNNKPLSTLAEIMQPWPQRLANAEVAHKESLEENRRIKEAIERVEEELAGQGRVYVRASGTEPLIRVMLEGREVDQLCRLEDELIEVIKTELS